MSNLNKMTEQEIYKKAKKRVKAKKIFYVHFGVFLATSAFLFIINFLTKTDGVIWWAAIPTAGWGIGIVAHYVSVFGIGIVSQLFASFGFGEPVDDDWEEQELQKEMKRLKRQHRKDADDDITVPDEKLELKEFKKLRDEWDDRDFV